MKKLFSCVLALIALKFNAQDVGKLIIKNTVNQPFIVSLNGVRLTDQYSLKTTFERLDELNYSAKLLLSGVQTPLVFNVSSTPNYESVYVLLKDQYNNYKIALESKTLLSAVAQTIAPTTTVNPINNTNGLPIAEADYQNMVNMLKDASMESSRLEMAKSFIHNRKISSEQVTGFLKTFSFENTKKEYAKYAYPKTGDKENYYKIYEVFSFSSSKTEIADFIKNYK